jgi:SNF2 family DNA or RNA helicase
MGKSAVVIALVAANPPPIDEHPTLEAVKDSRRVKGLLDVKATVLLTSISLTGQWQDEFQKHAPELKVYRHHLPSGYKLKMAELFDADVVISTATVKLADCFTTNYQFHRVVLDEAHLLGTS